MIVWRRHMRNGCVPTANIHQPLVRAENHLTAYGGHREVYRKTWELGSYSGSAGTNSLGRFRFRTNHGATILQYVVLLGLDNPGATATDPYLEIDTTISGGATTTSQVHYGLSAVAGDDGPDEQYGVAVQVTVTPATVYEVNIKAADYCRPLAVMAFERASPTIDEATNYMNTHQPLAGAPIYDADRQQLLSGLSNMYRYGGQTFHWSLFEGNARTRTSSTPINLIDNTETGTPTAASYAPFLDNRYHNTASRTTVPFELGVYGSIGAGSGTVRLIDTAGNTYCAVTVNGAAGWYTATGLLPNTNAQYALQFYSDNVNTMSVYAASLISWETGP
jgi:hypothetical protein